MSDPARLGAIARAFRHSLDGIAAALRERAFVQELVVVVPLVVVAWTLPFTLLERALMTASLLLILLVELLNSAIEAVTDLASPQQHPLAKRAKDTASAAVLIAIVIAAVTWASVLWVHYGSAATGH